jgi:ABC-type branched-subunit amino acid transport system permease subunit
MQRKRVNYELWGVALATLVFLVVLPALNAFTPAGSALHISSFTINLYGKYLCYAILAISVDLLWGYTGLLSLGQCLFFALGGYAWGMYLMLLIGRLGQYRSNLPDFMVFLGYPQLPEDWVPFRHLWFAVAAVVCVPALVALVFGYLAFRSRIRGVYFSILTQALTYAACLMFFRNDFTFGGNNGLTDFKFMLGSPALTAADIRDPAAFAGKLKDGSDAVSKFVWSQLSTNSQQAVVGLAAGQPAGPLEPALLGDINTLIASQPLYDKTRFAGITVPAKCQELIAVGADLPDAQMLQLNRMLLQAAYPGVLAARSFLGYAVNTPATQRALYICTVLLLLATYGLCKWLTATKFGKVQRAIRDSENRVLFSGYATANFKLFVFVLAAIIAGLAGALYVPQVGIINPSDMATDKSLEAVVWVAVGGRGTLIGPVLGAFVINAMKSWATRAYPDLWLLFLGAMFILVTLFMPKGIVGLPAQLGALRRKFFARKSAPAEPVPAKTEMKAEMLSAADKTEPLPKTE